MHPMNQPKTLAIAIFALMGTASTQIYAQNDEVESLKKSTGTSSAARKKYSEFQCDSRAIEASACFAAKL